MVLLNHLFGSRKGIEKELAMDNDKRMALWQEHVSNHSKRESLCKHFSYKNIDNALADFDATLGVLTQIESLISPELIIISDEEKLDEEILADLEMLQSTDEIVSLSQEFAYEKDKQVSLLALFKEIHDVLKAELHLIRLIRKKPSNIRGLLLQLFCLIDRNEFLLYKPFREECFHEKSLHAKLSKLVRAVIFEEELEEEIETEAEIFAREIVKKMAPTESRRQYRKLGEDIFLKLADMAGAPLPPGEDILEGIKKLEAFAGDEALLRRIIKKLRPKYDDLRVKAVIMAFRQAHNNGHFIDLESEFAT